MLNRISVGSEQALFQQKLFYIKEYLNFDFTTFWTYKDRYASPAQLGASVQLVQKSVANLGDESRLQRLLVHGLRGQKISMIVVGGSISRGAPFIEEGSVGSWIYFNAIAGWWNTMFKDITGSVMEINSVSLGGIGTDYFSYCLDSHVGETSMPELLIWELSANDYNRYADKPFNPGEPLEQFTRNALRRSSRPALLFLNFFRGADAGSKNCPNYEDSGELDVARHYNITSLSWRNYVCDYIQLHDINFGFNATFATDHFHPSILGHAQMAFIVINYLRNAFLRVLRGPAGLATTDESFGDLVDNAAFTLPPVLYPDTINGQPLCFTYLQSNINQELNNSLSCVVTRQDDYKFNIFKQFKIREDKFGGMQTHVSEQLIQFLVHLPRFFSRMVLVSHATSGSAQVWLDHQTPVLINTENYHMGTLLTEISTNIQPGKHVVNVLSLKNGFVVCAIGVL
eukprot:gene17694-19462_t